MNSSFAKGRCTWRHIEDSKWTQYSGHWLNVRFGCSTAVIDVGGCPMYPYRLACNSWASWKLVFRDVPCNFVALFSSSCQYFVAFSTFVVAVVPKRAFGQVVAVGSGIWVYQFRLSTFQKRFDKIIIKYFSCVILWAVSWLLISASSRFEFCSGFVSLWQGDEMRF